MQKHIRYKLQVPKALVPKEITGLRGIKRVGIAKIRAN